MTTRFLPLAFFFAFLPLGFFFAFLAKGFTGLGLT